MNRVKLDITNLIYRLIIRTTNQPPLNGCHGQNSVIDCKILSPNIFLVRMKLQTLAHID